MIMRSALAAVLVLLGAVGPCPAEAIPIVAPMADAWRSAAEELAGGLSKLYPEQQFALAARLPAAGRAIAIEQDAKMAPESFRVSHRREAGLELGSVQAADARGAAYGVARLLERLGAGFYLSFHTLPQERRPFSFDAWKLDARPLATDRLVFNWHNFLSGCSTWDAPQWKEWVVRARQMGFNGVMVHAYGNNPMAGFTFQGRWKPVGYLSSSRVGRDWSVNHVDDVRRLWGGSVFDSPTFGCRAAVAGSDAERTRAARSLMTEAFAEAGRLAMNVFFAVDVDTASANPQELITLLPESARFRTNDLWLARPDTPEGYALYRAQVSDLMAAYPQINTLVVWHRVGRTPWMDVPLAALPRAWQEEFAAACAARPETRKLWRAHNLFAEAKIVAAFRRALDELGRKDVRLAVGSWNFDFLPGADRFLPREVMLIGLDAAVLFNASLFDTPERWPEIAAVAARRPVLPIAWAHHDDGNYVGRPYTPPAGFHQRLARMGCGQSGFGIIHWMTRPLDLYFKSLVNQVWEDRADEPLQATCRRMAEDCLGPGRAEAFGDYLYDWVTTMPKIARETSDFFVDQPLALTPELEAGFARRAKRLQAIDTATLSKSGRDWVAYYQGLERYVADIIHNESRLNEGMKAFSAGQADAARSAIAECRSEEAIERFAEFSRLGGISRGEQGLVVSMNTRWLTHYQRVRQALGMEPVRIRYAATSHDPLAQAAGKFTFHFGPGRELWETQGQAETQGEPFCLPADVKIANPQRLDASLAEVCRSGVTFAGPGELTIRPIFPREKLFKHSTQLPAGAFQLELLLVEPSCEAAGQRVFDVVVADDRGHELARRTVDVFAQAGGRHRAVALAWPVRLERPGTFKVRLAPVRGQALICGAVLTPQPASRATRSALDVVRAYADAMLDPAKGRDHFGANPTPLFATVLDRKTYRIPDGNVDDLYRARVAQEFKSIANPHFDQALFQVLYALATVTGQRRYAEEADRTMACFVSHCQEPKYGFFTWGEHIGWDLVEDRMGGFPPDRPSAAIHEFWRPWIYWDKSFQMAPQACRRYAEAVWKYQIDHRGPGISWSRHAQVLSDPPNRRGFEFPRHGGFYIDTWAHAYKHTRDPLMLEAIGALVDYLYAARHPSSGAIPHYAAMPDWLRPQSNVGLAINLWDAAPLVPEALGKRMRKLALEIDDVFLKLAHEPGPGGKGFVLTASTSTLEPTSLWFGSEGFTSKPSADGKSYLRHKPYTEGWVSAYVGPVPHSTMVGYCIARQRQIPSDGYRRLVVLTADRYLESEPDLAPRTEDGNRVIPKVDAGTIGRVIGLLNCAYRLTGDERYLRRAEWFSDWAIARFWPDALPLPLATVSAATPKNIFSAYAHPDTLAMNLLDTWLLRHRPELKIDFRWIDL